MQFFYLLNGWAGQNALLDGLMRGVYIAAIPVLATFLAALLIFRPARFVDAKTRVRRIALATFASILVCLLLMSAVNWFSATVLQAPILSSRPSMVHWVNALVVEPNDNSFPSPESAIIGVLCLSICAAAPSLALPSLLFALFFCVSRVFCGSNYPDDVIIGLGGGLAVNAFALSILRVRLRRARRFKATRRLEPVFAHLRYQMILAGVLAVSTTFGFWGALDSSRHIEQMRTFWSREESASAKTIFPKNATAQNDFKSAKFTKIAGAQNAKVPNSKNENASAKAAVPRVSSTRPSSAKSASATKSADIEDSKGATTSDVSRADAPREGEGNSNGSSAGATNLAPVKEVPRPGTTSLGGNFPSGAKKLLTALKNAHLAHALVSVEVAVLRGGAQSDTDDEAHFASVRFQVRGAGANERKLVAQSAARIVRIAFSLDEKLQNVDVTGVVLSDFERDKIKYAVFGDGMIPVFTASIQRKNLILPPSQAWLNASNADAGSWLRARSRLYINARVLPQNALASNVAPLFQDAETTQNSASANANPTPPIADKSPIPTSKTVIPPAAIPRLATPTPHAKPSATPFAKPQTPALQIPPKSVPQKAATPSKSVTPNAPISSPKVTPKNATPTPIPTTKSPSVAKNSSASSVRNATNSGATKVPNAAKSIVPKSPIVTRKSDAPQRKRATSSTRTRRKSSVLRRRTRTRVYREKRTYSSRYRVKKRYRPRYRFRSE